MNAVRSGEWKRKGVGVWVHGFARIGKWGVRAEGKGRFVWYQYLHRYSRGNEGDKLKINLLRFRIAEAQRVVWLDGAFYTCING